MSKQALEGARWFIQQTDYPPFDPEPLLKAIDEALAQPEQEPVAWIEHHKAGDNLVWDEPSKGTPLYTKEQL